MGRLRHTATRLPNGRILIAGGTTSIGSTATAELYDPVKNVYFKTGTMLHDRQDHSATLLPNGKVLIAGGLSNAAGGITYSTELYDPATGAFTQPPQVQWLWTNRSQHVATLLASGQVLMTGGFTSGITPTKKAEVYDPNSGFFSPVGDMNTPRVGHAVTATNMPDNELLVIGGSQFFVPGALDTVEIFNPSTGAFTLTGSLFNDRNRLTATLLLDSTVLVVGGIGDDVGVGATAELSKPTHCGPSITQLTPASGLAGTPVSISGSQFGGVQGNSTVTFNGMNAGISSWSLNGDRHRRTGWRHHWTGRRHGRRPCEQRRQFHRWCPGPDHSKHRDGSSGAGTGTNGQCGGDRQESRHCGRREGFLSTSSTTLRHRLHPSASLRAPSALWRLARRSNAKGPSRMRRLEPTRCGRKWISTSSSPRAMKGNNVFGPQPISVQPGPPDLVATNVSNPPASAALGSSFVLEETVDNIPAPVPQGARRRATTCRSMR